MNREIKFRGKRVDNGEWVQGFLIKSRVVDDWHCSCDWVYSIQVEHLDNGSYYRYMVYEIETPTVGQFTGLTDKNGVELFEGDLMQWTSTDTDGSLMKQIDEIRYSDAGFICGKEDECLIYYLMFNPTYENIELIGNIHEVNK